MPPNDTGPSPGVDVADRDRIAETATRTIAIDCLLAGIDAALPSRLVADRIDVETGTLRIRPVDGTAHEYDLAGYDRVLLLGGGKAAGGLAAELAALLGDVLDDGVVVTRDSPDDGRSDDGTIDIVQGSHPVPGEQAQKATERILELASGAHERTLVLVALTGGGSALLPSPAGGLTLSELQETTDALLRAGVPIDGINAVRKHCSSIKGGRLAAAAAPATVVTIAISDVVGDDPATIASGPTVPDPTTYADALDVLDRYDVDLPTSVSAHLEAGTTGDRPETPNDRSGWGEHGYHLLATNRTAIRAARSVARERGYATLVLSTSITGEASEVGALFPAIADETLATGEPIDPPAVVLSGGETTVTVTGAGRGGPNAECALSAALDLDADRVVVASIDTDGVDGNSDAAGGIVDGSTVENPTEARDALDRNDAATYLEEQDGSVVTGPTGTNVNDLRVLVIDDQSTDAT